MSTVCLNGFNRNKPKLDIPVFSLHQCLQCAVKNKQNQISICSKYDRWCAFNFPQVPSWSMLRMPSNSDAKNVIFEKKLVSLPAFTPVISCLLIICSTSSAIFLCLSVECHLSFLHFFAFNLLQSESWLPHKPIINLLKLADSILALQCPALKVYSNMCCSLRIT